MCLLEITEQGPNKQELLDRCVAALEKAAEWGGARKDVLENDLQKGDLVELTADSRYHNELALIKDGFRMAWNRQEQARRDRLSSWATP